MNLILFYHKFWGKPLRVNVFSVRPSYVGINSLNVLIMLWSSTPRLLREVTVHDILHPMYEKEDNFCSCLYFRADQVMCNSVHNSRIRVYLSCVISFVATE